MLSEEIWDIAVYGALRLIARVFTGCQIARYSFSTASHLTSTAAVTVARGLAQPSVDVQFVPVLNASDIVGLLLIAAVVSAIIYYSVFFSRKVWVKHGVIESILEAQRKAQQFDLARNEVLETIARNAPLVESIERLALAVEQQFPGSLCAIVMPLDSASSLGNSGSTVLIAPGLHEDLQSAFTATVASTLLCAGSDPVETRSAQISDRLFSNFTQCGTTISGSPHCRSLLYNSFDGRTIGLIH